jgi:three-Cys-motif partner protein
MFERFYIAFYASLLYSCSTGFAGSSLYVVSLCEVESISAAWRSCKMSKNDFFAERREQSFVKTQIVWKYFKAWARIMVGQVENRGGKIAYLDLFSGPGKYKDGSKSTPILILEEAIQHEKMRRMLITIFNDIDRENSEALRKEISALPGISTLKYAPKVYNTEVDAEIIKLFREVSRVPTLFFADPWGYKGLSLRLINSVLRNWGCDCIFFFNYNRINMGLSNPLVAMHMKALFGESRANNLQDRLEHLPPLKREEVIVEEFKTALEEIGGTYVLPFSFKDDRGTRTTHHLVFVCKHHLGYNIMKGIMAKVSSDFDQGVPSFAYNPKETHAEVHQLLLFEEFRELRPLEALEQELLHDFAGCTVTVEQVFNQHSIGKRYIRKNYDEAFRNLEQRGAIIADVPIEKRRKRGGKESMKGVLFTFPSK